MKQRIKMILGRIGDRIFVAPVRTWKAWRQRRHTLRILRRLTHHQLKDIGLTSHDVDRFR